MIEKSWSRQGKSMPQHPGTRTLLLRLEISQLGLYEALLAHRFRTCRTMVATAAAGVATSALGSTFRLHRGRTTGAESWFVTATLIGRMREADIAVHKREIRSHDVALRHTAAHGARGGFIALLDAAEQFEVTAVLAGKIVYGHEEGRLRWEALFTPSTRSSEDWTLERPGVMGVGLF
jgi:hypothetical protein